MSSCRIQESFHEIFVVRFINNLIRTALFEKLSDSSRPREKSRDWLPAVQGGPGSNPGQSGGRRKQNRRRREGDDEFLECCKNAKAAFIQFFVFAFTCQAWFQSERNILLHRHECCRNAKESDICHDCRWHWRLKNIFVIIMRCDSAWIKNKVLNAKQINQSRECGECRESWKQSQPLASFLSYDWAKIRKKLIWKIINCEGTNQRIIKYF